MSNNVDKRVVQMEFDNAEFEKKVAQSRKTIKRLKNDLDFDGNVKNLNSLNKSIKNFDMTGMAANIEKISDRFSTMGIVGATIIQDLTNSVLSFGRRVASSTFGQILSGGTSRARNLELAQFQIAGLSEGQDWKKIGLDMGKSLYDQINDAVTGTAYGLDSAAKVAGQLLASNIQAGTQDMQNALSGISGVAAMTNSTYEEIGHIFTTIAGNGRVMGEQLNQFAARGLNVAAELAKAYQVDEETLRSMVSKGKVDFKTFAAAMNKAFGEMATKANDTYDGALSNVKAALSRLGEGFMTPYRNNMRKFFVELIPVLNATKKTIEPVYTIAISGMEKLSNAATWLLKKLAFKDEKGLHLTGLQQVAFWIAKISDLLYEVGDDGWSAFGRLQQSVYVVLDIVLSLANLVKTLLQPVFTGFTKAAFKGMNPLLKITQLFDKGLRSLSFFIKQVVVLIDEAINQNDALSRVIAGITVTLKGPMKLLGLLLKIVGGAIKLSIRATGVLLQILAPIGDLIVALHKTFIESKLIKDIFTPLGKALKALGSTLSTLANIFWMFFTSALKPLRVETKETTDIWNGFVNAIKNALSSFVKFTTKYIGIFSNFLMNHQEAIQKAASAIGNAFVYAFGAIKTGWDKIKSLITSFKGTNNVFGAVASKFQEFRDNISNSVESFKDIKVDGIQSFATNLKDSLLQSTGPLQSFARFLVTFWETLKSVFSKVWPLIKTVVTVIFDGLSSILLLIKNGFDSLNVASISSVLTSGGVVAGLAVLLKYLTGLFKAISDVEKKSPLERLLSFMDDLKKYVDQLAKTKAAEALKNFATALLEIAAAIFILSFIDPDKMFAALVAISILIAELVYAFKAMDKSSIAAAKSTAFISSALVKMASSLLILAFAIKILAEMDPKNVGASAIFVSALLWELVGVMKALSQASDSEKKVTKGAMSLIIMAFAVKMLAKSVAELAGLNPKNVAVSALAIVSIAASLAKLSEYLHKNGDGLIKAGVSLIVISFAISRLAKVLSNLAKLDRGSLILATSVVSVMVILLKKLIEMKADALDKISKTIKSIAFSMILLAISFKIFENVDPEAMKKAGIALGAVLASMVVMLAGLWALDRFTKNGTDYSKALLGIGAALAGLGVAVAGLAAAAKLLTGVDWSALAKAGVVLAGALLAVTVLALLSKIKMNYKNMLSMAGALVALAGALVVFGVAMAIFTAVPILGIVKGLTTLVVVLGILIGATYALKNGNVNVLIGLAKALALLGLGMVLFGAGLLVFASAIPLLASSVGMIEVIFAGMLAMIAKLIPMITEALGSIIKAILQSIIMSIPVLKATIIASITEVLDVLNAVVPKLGKTLDVILHTIFPLLREWIPKILKFIFSLIPQITEGLVEILIKTVELLAERVPDLVFAIAKFFQNLIGAIKEVAGVEFTPEKMTSILVGLGVFALILVIIAAAANIAQKAIGGMIALMLFVGLLSFMFIALMSLDTETFINVCTGLGEALLALSAAIFILSHVPIAGAAEGALGLIVIVAILTTVLVALGAIAKECTEMKGYIEEGIEIFGMLGTAIGTFVGNLLGSLMGGLSTALPTIADNLSLFMVKATPFLLGLKLLNQTMLEGAMTLAEIILIFTGASLLEGIASFFGGGLDLEKFGKQLVKFVPYMAEFGEKTAGVKTGSIKRAAEAAKALAEFAAAIPNSGGVAGFFAGENDIDKFGEKIRTFATHLIAFNNKLVANGGINKGIIVNASEAMTAVAKMAKDIPNSGGVAGFFAGENDIDEFGVKIRTFATHLIAFNNKLVANGGINKDIISNAMEAVAAVVKTASDIPNSGGVAGFFAGENDIDKFGVKIRTFATHLIAFNNKLVANGGINKDIISNAMTIIKDVILIAKEIPNENGFVSLFTGDQSLEEFSKHLVSLGENLKTFSDELDNVNLSRVNTATKGLIALAKVALALSGIDKNNIKYFSESIETLGKTNVEAFLSAFENAESDCNKAITEFTKTFNDALAALLPNYTAKAATVVKTFAEGIIQNKAVAYSAFSQVIADSIRSFSDFNDALFWIGANYVTGIANGIYAHEFYVINAAIDVGTAAIKATHDTLQERSPSRIGFDAGKYWDLGIANGMTKFAYTVSEASESVSKEAINYAGYLQSAIDSVDFDNIDPTIRPVMDLSNVDTGLKAISELMRDSRTYSIGAAISRDRAEYDRRTNTIKVEATSKDVVEAVGKLEDRIDALGDRINNMGVYLDKKTMVGGMIDTIDRGLGQKAVRNSTGGVKYGRVVQR